MGTNYLTELFITSSLYYSYRQDFVTYVTEPGFYQEGQFGIRLENVLEVIDSHFVSYLL